MAAIEIYNKPKISYRSECFVILLANAWELCLKALLSRNRVRIFYPKQRDKPYSTLSMLDAIDAAKPYFPANVPHRAISANLHALADYRNNAIHFYNQAGMDILLYGLGQTAIVNFRDLAISALDRDVADEVNLCLMPLSFRSPPDPIEFIRSHAGSDNSFLSAYLKLISDTTRDLEDANVDTGRFLTVFTVNLQSTKKIQSADVVAGVQNQSPEGILLVERKVDPNKTHPLLRKAIMADIGKSLNGVRFTTHTFEAIAWQHKLKDNQRYCWRSDCGGTTQYSRDVLVFIKKLKASEVQDALAAYRDRNRQTG